MLQADIASQCSLSKCYADPAGGNMEKQLEYIVERLKIFDRDKYEIELIILVGSYARNEQKINSDIDIMILSNNPTALIEDVLSSQFFDNEKSKIKEIYGNTTSIRLYTSDIELELSISDLNWISIPLDYGVERILQDGFQIIYDKKNVMKFIEKYINLKLIKAGINDAAEIHRMQITAFEDLLSKYQDHDMSPGNESLQKIEQKIQQDSSVYYFIKYQDNNVGALRVVFNTDDNNCRISPIFIMKEFRNLKLAKAAMLKLETKYNPVNGWYLDTIKEEESNCHLYEKMGYEKTGKEEIIKDNMTIIYYHKKCITTAST